MRELIDAFYRERSLANHHIMSYNDFVNYWLQDIIDKIKVGDDETERGTITTDIEGYEVKLGKIRVGNPLVKEADGSTRLLTPMEARLRNLTYEAPMYLEFIPIIEGVEHEPEEVRIGDMPIMVKSAKCNITKENLERHEGTIFTPEEYYKRLVELQEDPIDIGGYFIINGTERVLISLEDLAPNRVMVEFNKRYGRDVPVARACRRRWLNTSDRTAVETFNSRLREWARSSWYLRSFTRPVKATRKRSSMRSPASLRRLFA